ncbi:inositol-5-monophosphate dehydrogenase [Janibacter sp. HTCC2649]|uniref:hypothetical protein n=1 Tax=Janibacter sp. HTCC2649 TaxID=313589 RepID=UPI0000671A13|nr:hypothetical protein [Janibacter sp. HTCC2649]EAP98492.1 inositol-5-monophosphate dehydrogenase [Janibacter sp. HTCC2649]
MTAVVVAGVVLVAGGGTLAMGSILKDDPGSATAGPTTSASVSTTASPTSASTPSSTTSASPSPSAPDPAAAVAEAKAACVAQVSAAEGIAAAAKNSATHWKAHTDAYLEKKAGQYTLAQTKAQYAASKAFGLADEKAMAATTKTFMATGAACSNAAKTAPKDAAITACATRLKALGAVRTTGTRVQDEWSAHLRMMDKKAHTDEGAYFTMWVRAVNYAQKSVPAYAAAAATVAKAPACA